MLWLFCFLVFISYPDLHILFCVEYKCGIAMFVIYLTFSLSVVVFVFVFVWGFCLVFKLYIRIIKLNAIISLNNVIGLMLGSQRLHETSWGSNLCGCT